MDLQPITKVVTGNGSIGAGRKHIEFILSTDFAGTINGATIDPAIVAVYVLDAPPNYTLPAMKYTISAGSAVLTIF